MLTPIFAQVQCVKHVDQTLTRVGGVKKFSSISSSGGELGQALERLHETTTAFDAADAHLIDGDPLSYDSSTHREIADIFLFVHPVRQAADKVQLLTERVLEIQQQDKQWTVNLPSYSLNQILEQDQCAGPS